MLINMHEAKTHLSRLVERVASGEEIVIGRAGKPVARLVPYRESRPPRLPGSLRGKIQVSPDFDDTPLWLVEGFEGSPP